MATIEELQESIARFLDHPLGIGNFNTARLRADKAYEAYLFGLCLSAVRELGQVPVLRNIQNMPGPFVFRGAPGKIYSRAKNYGYATFSLNSIDFEVHCGVEIKGNSGMTHELDVSIMHAKHARNSRNSAVDPPAKSLVVGIECKFYSHVLPKSLAREFVGLVDDMGSKIYAKCLCSNSNSRQIRIYYSNSSRPDCHFSLEPTNADAERMLVEQIKRVLVKVSGATVRPVLEE